MPAVNAPLDHYLRDTLKKIRADVDALARQQNGGVRDSAQQQRLQYGMLPNGDFGFATFSRANDGTYSEILPPVIANEIDTLEATTSTSYTDLATVGPSCTVYVGALGRVNVLGGAYLAITGAASANPQAIIGLSVDGGAPSRPIMQLQDATGASATGVAMSTTGQQIVTGLSVGSHTFKLVYKGAGLGGNSVTFGYRTMLVQPF